jgi:hypothetical protein
MNLVNELRNDLVFAFLVEKKHQEKIAPKDVPALLGKVQDILQTVQIKATSIETDSEFAQNKSFNSHKN